MQQKISRRKIAQYVVTAHKAGTPLRLLIAEVAAYLIDTKRTREADLTVRAIEDAFAEQGIVVTRVTTAHPLDKQLRREIATRVGGDVASIDEIVDPEVVGGVRIETPGKILDATLKRKLLALRQAKL